MYVLILIAIWKVHQCYYDLILEEKSRLSALEYR